MEPQKTPLYQKHIDANAKIIDYAGWALPVEYTSMLKEAQAARRQCALFDATHMGQIRVAGDGAVRLLAQLVTNDIGSLKKGAMQYNLFLNEQAGIIDDCMVYHDDTGFLCVVNAANKDTVLQWVKAHADSDVTVSDETRELALLSLQGPRAESIVQHSLDERVASLEYMHFRLWQYDNYDIFVSRSGYTAEDGFELYIPWQHACFWWDRLLAAGGPSGLTPCGLGARDILRIEAGYPLYGHELTATIDPYSACLGWAVKADCQCVGYQALNRIRQSGAIQKRIGFIMKERALPRQGYRVVSADAEIGRVSSGTYSPNTEHFIGMAYVLKKYAQVGSEIGIEVRNKIYKAQIVHVPFITPQVKKGRQDYHEGPMVQ